MTHGDKVYYYRNVWLDSRIHAIDENKYYITEDENA